MYKLPNVLLFDCIFFRESFINDPSRTGLCRHASGIRNFVSLGHISTWSYHKKSSSWSALGDFFSSRQRSHKSLGFAKSVQSWDSPPTFVPQQKRENFESRHDVSISPVTFSSCFTIYHHCITLGGRVIKSLYKSFISPFSFVTGSAVLGWASARLYSISGVSRCYHLFFNFLYNYG